MLHTTGIEFTDNLNVGYCDGIIRKSYGIGEYSYEVDEYGLNVSITDIGLVPVLPPLSNVKSTVIVCAAVLTPTY